MGRTITLDETIIKVNGKCFYLYAALGRREERADVDAGICCEKLPLLRWTSIETVLRYCKNKPCFVVDEGPWSGIPAYSMRLGVRREHETFGRRSKVESVFSSYKQREQGLLQATSTSTSKEG
jgi:transposase-like protein